MASEKEAALLSLLESSGAGDVFSSFSDHLRPFSGLSGHRTSRKHDQTLAVRSLAKQFLPFLNTSLSLLPKRLSVANPTQEARESAVDLFRTYELCLDCLELVSTQLSCKPQTIQRQRLRLIYCFEAWGWYSQAYNHAFKVLERLRGSESSSRKRRFLPNVEPGEAELAMVVVEVVAALFKCVAMGQERDAAQYRTALALLGEVKPWFRALDANAYEKLQRVLATHLGKCALSLAREAVHFDEDLVHSFCEATLKEYSKSSLSREQIYKFARQVLSSLFALEERKTSLTVDVAMCILQIIACELQAETDENWVELVDIVSYCANKWRATGSICCARASKHLNEMAAIFSEAVPHVNLILRLYSVGLSINISDFKSKEGEVKETTNDWRIRALLDEEDRWQNLASLLGLIESYSGNSRMQTGVSSLVGHKSSDGQAHGSCKIKSKEAYGLSYVDALKFLCQPLVDLINSEKRKVVLETEIANAPAHLSVIQDTFHQLCDGCLSLQRGMPDKGSSGSDYNKTLLNVAMAAFILSMRTQLKMKISAHLVEETISSPWIQPRELKYLFASLYNIGVVLYRNKQLEKASKAFKLCFRASWTGVGLLCQMFVSQSNPSDDHLSEEAIIDFVSEACSRCAFYLDILQQRGRHKIKKFIVDIIEKWSAAENLIRRLPGPTPIVKQWVKMEHRWQVNLDRTDSCTTLYSLVLSSKKVSKRAIGKVLEQELLAYEELFPLCSNLSHQMQMAIADILLKDVYVTEDMHLQRARILVWKARTRRKSGTEHLRDCIEYLSEAISISGDECHKQNTCGTPFWHQLPVAYCLRALSIQEAEPDSKQVFQDISTALNLWLKVPTSDDSHEDSQDSIRPENMIPLLYNIIDLLSMKGCLELHHHLYQLIFRLFKWKTVKLEVCLAMLWECRRLSHALCPSPISDAFIMSLSEYCGEKSKSIGFWIDCLKVSKAKLMGFQQNFHFLHYDSSQISDKRENTFQPDITVDDIKDAASELILSVPLPSHSAFLAAYLYYDLCERFISYGKFSEALSYAKEAHRIRTRTFQEKFKYTVEKQVEKHNDTGKITGTRTYGVKNIEVLKSIATDVWPCGNFLWDINGYYLSPWNVLQCYLESTLQVGIVNELIGNGAEAETFLSWGKTISCSQSLLPFVIAFSSALGNLYHKRQSLDLAAKELQSAKEILIDSGRDFTCLKCRLMLEVTLDKQLGDLSRSHFDSAARDSQRDGLLQAKSLFSAALDKLSCSAWKDCISCHAEANDDGRENRNNGEKRLADRSGKTKPCTKKGPTANRDARKGRRSKSTQSCSSKEQNLISARGTRLTRSKHQSLNEQCQSCSANMHIDVSKKPNFSDESECLGERESLLGTKTVGICLCNNRKCQRRLSEEVMDSGLLNNLISLKWEFCCRRLACLVLDSLGKCLADSGKLHQAHEMILQSISVLCIRKPSSHSSSSVSHLLDFVGTELKGDVFAVERAEILYSICSFSLTNYHSKGGRSICCDLAHIPLPKVVSFLTLAFVLSRDVPILFQKVSKLLAALYLLSASNAEFSFQYDGNKLSASHWASFFHQASVGTHISYLFFSNLSQSHKSLCLSDTEGTQATGSTCTGAEKLDLPRLAPGSTRDLAEFAKDFLNSLPGSTIICISLLGGALNRLLQELTQIPSPVSAWLLLSRLNAKDQPVAILLPVDSVLEDISDDNSNPSFTEATEIKDLDKPWLCPWGSTVADDVAPTFKSILEENYFSSSEFPPEDTKETRYLWWMRRKKLDHRLGKFLRNLEDSWLGPWRHLLLGEWLNCKLPDSAQKKLVKDLWSKCKMDVNETLLKVVLGGGMDDFKGEACVAQLCLKNGCYVGRGGYFDEEDSCRTPTSGSNNSENRLGLALQLIHEAATKSEQEDNEIREPIILVLDPEVQMLPWENIPILRRQEVYRMPSVGSISAVLKKRSLLEDPAGCYVASFPLIDPLDAFYLLNPGGDLGNTQVEFESWFRDQNLEGKAGSVPTVQELTEALKNHDLFLYFGHGSGAQYISRHDIENLENCAATFLMGCSSGSLLLNGCYVPQGIPLSYLLAGSPAIVANLWEVTDKDIDRFGKAMLESWLRERSDSSEGCSQCNSLVNGLAAMNIKGNNAKKKTLNKKPAETNVNGSSKTQCDHRRRKIGSFMAGAREACNLPFLIGAAPVCYGVPTGITRKKKDLKHAPKAEYGSGK